MASLDDSTADLWIGKQVGIPLFQRIHSSNLTFGSMVLVDVFPRYEQTLAALQVEHRGRNSAAESEINEDLEQLIDFEKPMNVENIKDIAIKTTR